MTYISQYKLLFVIKNSALNRGMNTGIENLAWSLAERGASVYILTGGTRPKQHGYHVPSNAIYFFTGGSGKPFDHMFLYSQLRQTHLFDAVIGWLLNIAPLSTMEKSNTERPKFIAHEGQINKKPTLAQRVKFLTAPAKISFQVPRLKNLFWDNVIQTIDAVVPNTYTVSTNTQHVYRIPRSLCTVIPRGIDTNFFSPDPSLDRSKLSDPPRLIFAGNISMQKGLGDIVEALAYINRPVEFILCGNDKGYLNTLNRRLAEISYHHTINFTGPLDPKQLVTKLHSADIFIFCSWGEGIGKSLLEAMACGLPVITSDIDSIDYVKNEVNGLIARERDSESIAKAINRYLEDPGLRRSCAINARKTVEISFGKDVEIDAWCTLLDEHLNSGP